MKIDEVIWRGRDKIDDVIYEGTCICTAISSSNDNDKNDGQNHQQEDNSDEDGDNGQQPHWVVGGQISCGGRQLFLRRLQRIEREIMYRLVVEFLGLPIMQRASIWVP